MPRNDSNLAESILTRIKCPPEKTLEAMRHDPGVNKLLQYVEGAKLLKERSGKDVYDNDGWFQVRLDEDQMQCAMHLIREDNGLFQFVHQNMRFQYFHNDHVLSIYEEDPLATRFLDNMARLIELAKLSAPLYHQYFFSGALFRQDLILDSAGAHNILIAPDLAYTAHEHPILVIEICSPTKAKDMKRVVRNHARVSDGRTKMIIWYVIMKSGAYGQFLLLKRGGARIFRRASGEKPFIHFFDEKGLWSHGQIGDESSELCLAQKFFTYQPQDDFETLEIPEMDIIGAWKEAVEWTNLHGTNVPNDNIRTRPVPGTFPPNEHLCTEVGGCINEVEKEDVENDI